MARTSYRQSQLVLPLLEALEERTAPARIGDLYDIVADKIDLADDTRRAKLQIGAHSYNGFERSVRWAQQRAKLMGLMSPAEGRTWELTGKGQGALRKAVPGMVVTIFVTDRGAALYGHCEDAVGSIDDGSVNLIFSSPPYPLLRKKEYGNRDEATYVNWFLRIAEGWGRKLTKDGSVVINLGDAWRRGEPTLSLYQERLLIRLEDELGMKLCQRFAWQNPAKMPVPAEWVTIRRVRVKPSLESIFWLSPSDQPYANNRAILTPYSDSMRKVIKDGGQKGSTSPAGYQKDEGAFARDNGGAIPGNLITAPNTESNSHYIRWCKERGLPVHPARFPAEVPEHFIKFLTRADDLVFDPFGGSLTTGAVAERLGRRWIASECMLDYIEGGRARFA
jgi:site-specific DNA-methyltransferase (cytosine-N4-specific)